MCYVAADEINAIMWKNLFKIFCMVSSKGLTIFSTVMQFIRTWIGYSSLQLAYALNDQFHDIIVHLEC